ncbi:MAG: 16S rRNA (uracil(1498)-N(3))-methyltransferase [Alphaproteobacteria bacterium]
MSIRLHVAGGLAAGAEISLPDRAAHYLVAVMRRRPGDEIRLFNALDGEWRARLATAGRKEATALVAERVRAPRPEPDLWLLFAPPKGSRQDMVIEKGTELGVARFLPVRLQRSVVDRVNPARLEAIAIEAAEQCERLTIPVIEPMVSLDARLAAWPAGRRLIVCDETGAPPLADCLVDQRADRMARRDAAPSGWGILVGPEGGLAPAELDALGKLAFVVRASLGPRILRAETASILAVGLWQSLLGDGRAAPEPRPRPAMGASIERQQQDK